MTVKRLNKKREAAIADGKIELAEFCQREIDRRKVTAAKRKTQRRLNRLGHLATEFIAENTGG